MSTRRVMAPMAVLVCRVGQHQMTGHAGLHGDACRLAVADLADHDDIGILTQDRPQAARKGQVGARIDLCLADAFHGVFDGVLDRQDIAHIVVQIAERRIKRGGLARTGRPGDKQDTLRPAQQTLERGKVAVRHADGIDAKPRCIAVEQAHDDAFAILRGNCRDTHIDLVIPDAQRNAAILRQAFFRQCRDAP